MQITTELIKALRDETGVSVMQCKKALEEANGDREMALLVLKKKSSEAAAKKGDREAAAGAIIVTGTGTKKVMLTLNCETDFVAKNEDFLNLANTLGAQALTSGANALTAAAPEMINPVIQKIGENIKLGSVEVFEGANVGSYVHDGHIGVVTILEGGDEAVAKDLAMHIAAMNPEYTTREQVPAEKLGLLSEMFREEVEASDKPADIKAKMLDGKVSAYLRDLVLMEQSFFKNPDQTIEKLLGSKNAKLISYKRIAI